MTHEELLAKISDLGDNCLGIMAGAIISDALRAVVELHQPIWTFPVKSNNSIPICIQCRDGDFLADYPCLTIQAIEKALR